MEKTDTITKNDLEEVIKDNYEISKPTKSKAVLVFFGVYSEKARDIKREFKILESANEKGIAVVYMNYNQKLWLEETEQKKLAEQLKNIFNENDLPETKAYLGGFSSGGNVAFLISDFLSLQNSELTPKGIFVIDSPIDLVGIFKSSEKNVERNFSEPSVREVPGFLKH